MKLTHIAALAIIATFAAAAGCEPDARWQYFHYTERQDDVSYEWCVNTCNGCVECLGWCTYIVHDDCETLDQSTTCFGWEGGCTVAEKRCVACGDLMPWVRVDESVTPSPNTQAQSMSPDTPTQ